MTTKPDFLLESPKPQIKQRLYNGRKLTVWEGNLKISSIQGWVDNPRIELAKKKFISTFGNRELTQDEILEIMKNDPEVKLKELRDDIINNGLRAPLTLSFQGKLLDGNRRFFAIKFALDGVPESDPNRKDLETVAAFVLTEDTPESDEQHVIVEENFSVSLKIQWPDYIKATKVVEANDAGLDIDDISLKFNWTKSKIRQTLRIQEIINEFLTYAVTPNDPDDEDNSGLGLTEQEAETLAAANYQFFNEAQKSYFEQLKIDFDFKIQFFQWIHNNKFSSFPEVRIAYKAWQDPEAKAAILQDEPTAAKSAKAIIDYNARVIRSKDEAIGKIDTFTKYLNGLTVDDIKLLPARTRKKLEKALELVIKMSKAASE